MDWVNRVTMPVVRAVLGVVLFLSVSASGCFGSGHGVQTGPPDSPPPNDSGSAQPDESGSPNSSTGDTPTPTPEPCKAPPDVLCFGKPVTVVSYGGGEPSLAVGPKGEYYVHAPGANVLAKSSDGGTTFRNLPYPDTHSGDSHVIVENTGRVYLLSDVPPDTPEQQAISANYFSIYTTDDDGAVWTRSPVEAFSAHEDRPWMAAAGNGVVYVTWDRPGLNGGQGQDQMMKTADGGISWLPVRAFESHFWITYPFADKAAGILYVAVPNGPGVTMQVSEDGGATFASYEVANNRHNTHNDFVVGDTDDAGNVYVTWSDDADGQFEVRFAYSTDHGHTWSPSVVVSGGAGTQVMPWIAAGGNGKVVIAWYGADVAGDPNSLPSSAQWNLFAAQSLDAHSSQAAFSTVRVTPQAIHTGALCTQGSTCTPASRTLRDFFMVDIGPDGRTVVCYAEDGASGITATKVVVQTGGPLSR